MSNEWAAWAAGRGMQYLPTWPAMRGVFRGGGLQELGFPLPTDGWAGAFGGLGCFGFRLPGERPDAGTTVLAIRVPGVEFPPLTLQEADFLDDSPRVPIDEEFDLRWRVSSPSPQFARDIVGSALRAELLPVLPDFSAIWFERDAVLLAARGTVWAEAAERYLTLLRRIVDTIDTRVLDAIKVGRGARGTQASVPHRPGPALAPVAPRPLPGGGWAGWAGRRGWVHYPEAREIAERLRHLPWSPSLALDGFVGKFGSLPAFGWRIEARPGSSAPGRSIVCLRQPGLTVAPSVRLSRDNALLSELVGGEDVTVGAPAFDDQWRVTSESPTVARGLLRPSVWRLFTAEIPPFSELWFERDVATAVTSGPIAPEQVDAYLRFLHDVLSAVVRELAGE
ncbi:MAG: hypothetical protein QM713_10900 [Arachnia sp.]